LIYFFMNKCTKPLEYYQEKLEKSFKEYKNLIENNTININKRQ